MIMLTETYPAVVCPIALVSPVSFPRPHILPHACAMFSRLCRCLDVYAAFPFSSLLPGDDAWRGKVAGHPMKGRRLRGRT